MSHNESLEPDASTPPYLDEFFAECDEHIATARQTLLALEPLVDTPTADREEFQELFRAFHSVKGLSAMVGLRPAEDLAHHMESYLGALRQGRVRFNQQGFGALVEGLSSLVTILECYRTNRPIADLAELLKSLDELLPAANVPIAADPSDSQAPSVASDKLSSEQQARLDAEIGAGRFGWWVNFSPSAELAQRKINVNTVREELKAIGKLLFSSPKVVAGGRIAFVFLVVTATRNPVLVGREADGLTCKAYETELAQVDTPAESQREVARPSTEPHSVSPTNVVRVGLDRLDDMMRMVGDLAITRARYEQTLERMVSQIPASEWRTLQEHNGAFERQIRDLREGIMRARLVPIRDTFGRMQFIVRDLTREFAKDIRVELSGGETEVDKFIVERVMDPLLHLVRNAVSHGIERAADRAATGKSPVGLISLRARADGQTIIIETEDDGCGIDRPRILARAQQLGIVADSDMMDDIDVLDILCLPGFSTNESVDRASGRGIGMNVVKSTIEELGGTLALDSVPGKGTRFTIRLPLTLSITEALIFEVGAQTFALPQSSVTEVYEFEAAMVSALENNEIVVRRGSALPLVRLSTLFGQTPASRPMLYALVVGEGRKSVGLVVDRMLGLHEIVVRPLTDPLVCVRGIAGVTELGDGRLVLILDAQSAVRGADAQARERRLGIAQ